MRGMSLVELMVAVCILGTVFGSMAIVSRSGKDLYESGSLRSDLRTRTSRALERIMAELRVADVAALQLKALYKRHPAFDDQQCWLAASTSHAAHCVADGDGLRSAFAHHPSAFTIRARNWLHGDVRKGGDTFEVRLRGNAPAAGAVVDNGDGTYSATYTATVTGTYALHVTLGRKHIHGPPPPRNSAPRNSVLLSLTPPITQARRLRSSSTRTPPCRPTAPPTAPASSPPSPASPRTSRS